MEFEKIVDKLAEKYGKERFIEVFLKIYISGEISELNFSKKDIEEVVLPLVQLGLIKVENKYFQIRPEENKTRYDIFSISYKGEDFVQTILGELQLPKKTDFLVNKYPSKFLAFMIYFFMSGGQYYGGEEEEYQKLLYKDRLERLIDDFKRDMEKLKCAFWVKEHTSKRVDADDTTFMILPAFLETLQKRLPQEIVNSEMEEFDLTSLIEHYLLKPQAKENWHEEFLNKIEMRKLQNLWTDWKEKLTLENILLDQVVLDAKKLRAFLAKKIEKIQTTLIGCSESEEKTREFLRVLEVAKIVPSKSDISDIMASCEGRKDFSIFVSAIYRILHDQMHIKDEMVVDPVRCYFHHGKQDKRQELNRAKFEEFCRDCLINFEPVEGEWQILKDRVLERAINKVKEAKGTK